MEAILPVICFVVGGALGGLIAWWVCRGQAQQSAQHARAALEKDHAVLAERLQERERQVAQLNGEARQKDEAVRGLQMEISQLKDTRMQLVTMLEKEREEAKGKLLLLEDAKNNLSNAFKGLAADALKNNNESFLNLAKTRFETEQTAAQGELEQRKEAIAALVKPVQDSLKLVDEKIQALETKREGAYTGLTTQVQGLLDNGNLLRTETNNLVKALRTPNVRGRWGEIQLKRVVEIAGMIDHCDFYEQQSVGNDDKQLRPDMLIRLPGNVHIVVDSKAPLAAYLDALEAPDDETRKTKMHDHARHVSNHVDQLSKKSYWDQFQHSPEFVILFLPGENFFSAALEHLPSLIEKGVEQRVLIATPMTLISLLRAVAIGWRQERLSKTADEIRQYGKELYERITKLGEHFNDIGKSLGRAVDSYNNALGSLEKRVLPAARKFHELGAAGGDELAELQSLEKHPKSVQAPELLPAPVLLEAEEFSPADVQRRLA